MQSLRSNELQKAPHGATPVGSFSDRDSWSNLVAHGALTPGLLALLMTAATGLTLMHSPDAQAAGKTLAAAEISAPQVALQSPTHADQLRGTTQIRVAIKAGRYPAASLEMYVDNRLATNGAIALDAAMLPTAVFNWDTKIFADGPHLLSVIVTDSQGFKGRSDVQVYINNKGQSDVTPPTVKWLNVRHGDVIKGDFPVQVEATDDFGVKWVIITLNRSITSALKPPLRSAMANIPPYVLKLRDLPADRYVLNATAVDAKDNPGYAPPIEILIQPAFSPTTFPPTPGTPTGTIEIPTGSDKVSGGEVIAKTTKTIGEEPGTGAVAAKEPRVTLHSPEQIGGGSSLMQTSGDIAARAGTVERPRDIRLAGSAPLGTTRAMPPAPPTVSTGVRNQQINGVIATSEIPSGNAQRAATKTPMMAAAPAMAARSLPSTGQLSRPTASSQNQALVATWQADGKRVSGSTPRPMASQPEFAPRSVPAPTLVNSAATRTELRVANQQRAAERTARSVASLMARPAAEVRVGGVTSSVPQVSAPALGHTSIAQTGAVAPSRVSGRIAASPVLPAAAKREPASAGLATVNSSAQTTVLAQAATNVARTTPLAERNASRARVVASAPAGTSRTATTETVQPTALSGIASNIVRQDTPVKATKITAPRLSSIPAGMPRYPSMPAPGSALPPTMPRATLPQFSMNPPMPGKSGEHRTLAAITVAPQSQWSAQAEPLPSTHVASRDESLSAIAKHYAMPVSVLAAANRLPENSKVAAGRSIALPRALSITYAGKPVTGDTPSFQMGSVGVTPFRFLFEKQGGKLTWNAKTHQVTATGPQGKVALTIGSRSAVVNQKETLMDLAAFLMSGRTMVPIRFFEQALHAQVDWDPATGRFYVATDGPAEG